MTAAKGTPVDLDKLRSIAYLGRGRSRDLVNEGRSHPETGRPFKTTTTEVGSVTEHNTKDDRVDAVARVETVRVVRDPATGKVSNT